MTLLLERDRTRIARRPYPREALAATVLDRLRHAGYVALRDVDCEVHDGVAILDGRLASYYLKQVAQEVTGRVEGIVGIENRLEVIARRVGHREGKPGGPAARWIVERAETTEPRH